MIRFTTLHSKYEVTVQNGKFHVKKFEAIDPAHTDNAVGQTRVSPTMRLSIGALAEFDTWSTSIVTHIEDV